MAALIAIPAAEIAIDGRPVDVLLPRDWLARSLADTDVRPRTLRDAAEPAGRVTGRLSRSGHDIVVRARVTASVETPCVRCLEPASLEVDAELALLLEPSARACRGQAARRSDRSARDREPNVERELTPADAARDVYDGETVVLDEFVREAILLEIPSFPLCRENCRGIVPRQVEPEDGGLGGRVDPRLAPLGAFRERSEQPATIAALAEAAAARSAALGRKPVLRSHHQGPVRKKRPKK